MEEDVDFEEQLKQEKIAEENKNIRKTYTDKDGTVYEWDEDKGAYFPKIDDNFIANYQMNYGATDPTKQETPYPPPPPTTDVNSKEYADWYQQYYGSYYSASDSGQSSTGQQVSDTQDSSKSGEDIDLSDDTKKYTPKEYFDYYAYYYGNEAAVEYLGYDYYKQEEGSKDNAEDDGKAKGKKRKKAAPQKEVEAKWFDVDQSKNTNVYVSGLPLDFTEEEFKELMNKCGLIMYDPKTRKPKLKLYMDEQGHPKGDGRCCYIKVESVDLALQILDGSEVKGHKISVERATFTLKGEFDPKRRKKLTNKEKRKLKEKQSKLFDWRPEKQESSRSKNEKVVVLKNMFDPKDFEVDPLLINSLRDDVRIEAGNLGEVKNVKIFDNHPDGVVMVYFKQHEDADACVAAFNHRWYSKRRIIAQTWDGKTKYEIEESEAERDLRLKKWENFLESGDKESDSKSVDNKTKEMKEGESEEKTKETETEDQSLIEEKNGDRQQACDSTE